MGAPSKVVVSSTHPRHSGSRERGPPAGPKQQYSASTPLPTKAPSQLYADQKNTNLRLLSRAFVGELPFENKLRSICLQAGGLHPHNSHHG
ncbi:hypothetical protein MTO96_041117 [Rhipicephalus appendiculatus]